MMEGAKERLKDEKKKSDTSLSDVHLFLWTKTDFEDINALERMLEAREKGE